MRAIEINGRVKGRTFRHTLAPVTLILGPNRSGKSAIADAIKLALLGRHPQLPNTNAGKFKLASGRDLLAELTFTDGQQNSIRLELAGGKIKETAATAFECPPVLLDFSTYLAMTADARTAYVFGKVDLDALGFSDSHILAAIKGVKLDPHTPAVEEVLRELASEAELLAQECDELGQSRQEFMAKLIERVKERSKAAKAVVKQMEANLQAQAKLQAADEAQDAQADAEQQLAELRASKIHAEKERAIQNERAKAFTIAKGNLERLRDRMDRTPAIDGVAEKIKLRDFLRAKLKEVATPQDRDAAWTVAFSEQQSAQDQIARLEAALLRLGVVPDVEGLRKLVAQAEEIYNALPEPQDYSEAYQKADREEQAARTDADNRKRAVAEIKERHKRELESNNVCPHCGKPVEPDIEARHAKELDEAKNRHEQAKLTTSKASEKLEKIRLKQRDQVERTEERRLANQRLIAQRAELAAAEQKAKQAAEITAEIEALKTKLTELTERANQASFEKKTVEAARATETTIRAEIDELTTAIESAASRSAEREQLQAQIKSAEEALDAMPPATMVDPEPFDKLLADADRQIETLEAAQRRAVAALQDQARREQAKAQLEAKKSDADASSAVANELIEKQEEMVAKAFGTILKKANLFTAGIMPDLEFHDGEIGYFEKGQWVSHQTFSGTERTVAFAGLSVALCADSQYRLVLIDEMGVMEPANRARLVMRASELIALGELDQFIACDYPTESYNGIALETEVAKIKVA